MGKAKVGFLAPLMIMLSIVGLSLPRLADARITQIIIDTVTAPDFGGVSFGNVGQFESLKGRAFGEVDPRNPLNAIIQDIDLAPKNDRGMVEYETDFYIIKPMNMALGNRTISYNIVNRGNLGQSNVGVVGGNTPTNMGDGFLQNRGFTQVWSGWQGDLLRTSGAAGRLSMDVPIATHRDGSVIQGVVRTEYVETTPLIPNAEGIGGSQALSEGTYTDATRSYETVSLDNTTATLTWRVNEADPRVLIPYTDWAFADCSTVPFPGVPSTTHICLKHGFDTNHIYELIYTGKNPNVLGLGWAAMRDFLSFLKYARADHFGTPNPLAGGIKYVLMDGTSQSGNALRNYLHLGFNEDEMGRKVVDGANPRGGTGNQPLNVRFGQPGRAPFQHTEHLFPRYEASQYWSRYWNPLRQWDGWILKRCTESHTCPLIAEDFSSTEWWDHRLSPSITDAFGRVDLEMPAKVRMYFAAGTPHAAAATNALCMYNPTNNNNNIYVYRANYIALYEWVTKGIEPPPSKYPTIREGLLVPPDKQKWPAVPGIVYYAHLTGLIDTDPVLDYGPQFRYEEESGIMTIQPPRLTGMEYTMLVPVVDADGNDLGGIRSNQMLAPIGTLTGWNYRAAGKSEWEQCDNTGIYVPFANTKAEREANNDPRLSLQERYKTHQGYVAAVTAAAQRLVAERYLLPEDAATMIANAEASNVLQ